MNHEKNLKSKKASVEKAENFFVQARQEFTEAKNAVLVEIDQTVAFADSRVKQIKVEADQKVAAVKSESTSTVAYLKELLTKY